MEKIKVVKSRMDTLELITDQFNGSMYYEQGEEASEIQFVLICTNVPIGSVVSFNCPQSGPQPPINLPPTKVTNQHFAVGIITHIPAHFVGTISYKVVFNQQPPANARVELQASYPSQG